MFGLERLSERSGMPAGRVRMDQNETGRLAVPGEEQDSPERRHRQSIWPQTSPERTLPFLRGKGAIHRPTRARVSCTCHKAIADDSFSTREEGMVGERLLV